MAEATTLRMNTETRDRVPAVDDWDGPMKHWARDLVDRLRCRAIGVEAFQDEVARRFADPALLPEIAPAVARALETRADVIFWRRDEGRWRDTLQLLYLGPREVHPPHGHHNLISNQMCVAGRIYMREYDRLARLSDDRVLLRIASDCWIGPGRCIATTEFHRNVHWFAADDAPAVMLNFYLLGYQQHTFDPPGEARRRGRQMIDPTREASDDGYVIGHEIPLAEGYSRFGLHAIADLPVPGR